MARATRYVSPRAGARDRHGRGVRSSVTGPQLPPLQSRLEFFDSCVAEAVDYLRELWPEEVASIHFQIGWSPVGALRREGVDRWHTDRARRTITFFRLPIERLARLHRDDDWHRRSYIESCVFRAVAELLGRDPWDIAPERYRHF